MNNITKPEAGNLSDYMRNYIDQAAGNNLIQSLKDTQNNNSALYLHTKANMQDYSYADGKWSIKDVLVHITDTERVFAYRALAFARGEKQNLPGYDQDIYAQYANTKQRSLADILKEYETVRASTICLFESLKHERLDIAGIANNLNVTPRILGWMISGHDAHHHNILKERYKAAFSLLQ